MIVDKVWGSSNSKNDSKTSIFDTKFENFKCFSLCNIIVFESIVAYQDKRENLG